MKQYLLLTALLPFCAFAGNPLNSTKPQKQLSSAKPAAAFSTIQHQPQNLVSAPFTPSPFLSLHNNAAASGLKVQRDPQTGMPIFIEDIPFSSVVTIGNSAEATQQVLQIISSTLGIKNASEEFSVIRTETDNIGMTHVKLQQVYKGLQVYGAQGWVHFSLNGKTSFNGRTVLSPIGTATLPALSNDAAQQIVKADVSQVNPFTVFSPADEVLFRLEQYVTELVLYPDVNVFGKCNLVWHVTVRPNVLNRWEYFIDAQNGAILNKYDNTCTLGPTTATAVDLQGITRTIGTFNANSTHYLIDASKSMYTGNNNFPGAGKGTIVTLDAQNTNMQNLQYVDITSASNSWNNPTAISAHYNAETSWDYFKSKFNRNSINGSGGDVVSFINVADDNGGGLDNAFWNGQYMFYGNGNTQFNKLAKGLDVGGHEMTHGVVQETANLEYQGESGAMNESFADVFGTLIDRDDWNLGEDVVKLSAFPTGVMRSMSDPHNGGTNLADNGWQPNHMNEKYTGSQDNGGVHINSGIVNHAYYLIANTIGKDEAEQIYYRALSNYLTKTSKFIDCRLAVIKAAEDIHGVGSNQANTAANSFAAVGIGNGTGTNTTPTLPNNPGGNKILVISLDNSDPNTLYLTDDAVTNFTPISTTPVNRKPSVTDNGSFALFVGTDHNIYSINLTNPYTQTQLTNDAYWDNVAVSKDGNRLAAVSQFQDTSVWVYDIALNQWGRFYLYNPTTGQGQNAGGVLYADALEWAFDGEFVMYDSYNKINGTNGGLDYWDVGFIRTWNFGTDNFGDGTVFKAYSSLPVGVSIGNPTFAKNSPYIIAFDYIDGNNSTYYVMGANLETSTTGTIFQNDRLGFPCYNPQDSKVAFNSSDNQSQPIVAFINVDGTKIVGNTASAVSAIVWGGYAQWYGTGSRPLPNAIEDVNYGSVLVYPNPAGSMLQVVLPENFGNGSIEVYSLLGEKVISQSNMDAKSVSIDVSVLNHGVYLLRLNNGDKTFVQRFEKH